jgi:serine/threonine protein kinase
MPKTRKLRRTRRRGGSLLGEGAYGCAFRPALACSRNTRNRPDQISKLMEGEDAVQELKQRDLFYKIDPDQKYFLYPFEICDPKMPFRPTNNVKKCHVPMEVMKILQSFDGGQGVDKIRLTVDQYIPFFASLSNLFEGLEKAHNHGIVHNDIKPDNIVILDTDSGFKTRFIDFGLSFKWDDLDSIAKDKKSPVTRNVRGSSVFDNNYRYWSIEIHFVNQNPLRNKRKLIQEFYNSVIIGDKAIPYRIFFKKTPLGEKPIIDEAYLNWLEGVLNKMSVHERYAIIFTNDDVFSMGRALAEIFYQRCGQRDEGMSTVRIKIDSNPLHLSSLKQQEFAKDVSTPFFSLVRQMMYPDIRTRISISDARTIYNKIVVPAIKKFFIGSFTNSERAKHKATWNAIL